MSDDQNVTLPVVETAPELEATAAPVIVELTPEITEDPPKSFTQEELDAIVSKRLAREQRKWQREQTQKLKQPEPPLGEVKPDDFETTDAYIDALASKRAEDLLNQRDALQRKAALDSEYREREEVAYDKYDDFEAVAYNPRLPITESMAEAIQSSEIGPDVAYYLGSNPKEAARISQLSPIQQGREIGKIEAKLATTPPVKKTSTAPAPITPVTAKSAGSPVTDTTDPRSISNMSVEAWIAAENERERKRLEAKYR